MLAAAGLGVVGLRCRLDRWLQELGESGDVSGPAPPASSSSGSGRARAPKPSRTARPPAPSVHLELGTPARTGRTKADPSDDHLMIKPQYALSYSRSRNGPMWVGWQLDASWFGDTPRHRGKFIADTSLPEGWYRVQHDDYTGSGFDRGHMVRSEERTRSVEDNKATFLLTNILPQRHDLNAGPWLRLEEACQELAQKQNKTLFLVAGGLFGARTEKIGHDVAVPEAFFKIAVVLDRGQGVADVGASTEVIAVVMPNDEGMLNEGWARYRTTVDEIERRAGYDFLTAVPEEVQQEIERR